MDNLKIKEFAQAIRNFVNEYDLPEEVKRMVLQEQAIEQEKMVNAALRIEIMARDKAEAEKQEEVKQDAESV